MQWFSIVLITVSIVLAAADQMANIDGASTTWGITFALGSVLSFGSNYVYQNALLRRADPPSVLVMGFCVGFPQLILLAVYFVAYVLPRWSVLVSDPIDEANQPLAFPSRGWQFSWSTMVCISF